MKKFIEALIETLKSFLESLKTKEQKKYNPPARLYRNRRALELAIKELGVKEVKGGRNKRIEEYHAYAAVDNDEYLKQEIPWCASFACWVLEKAGMGSTNSRLAKSFLHWGVSTKKKPMPGDLVIFDRGSLGWQGHVAFFLRMSGGYIWVCGGNQSNAVTIARYSTQRLNDIRRSSKHRKLSTGERQDLEDYVTGLLRNHRVNNGGSQA